MRQFLASVGEAKLFGRINGTFKHIANVKTLTEAGLSFNVEQEEIRAGTGAQLLGRFSHNSSIDITLVDIMWDLQYLALAVSDGSDPFFSGGNGVYHQEITTAGSMVTLDYAPQPLGNNCGLMNRVVWIKEVGCLAGSESTVIEVKENVKTIVVPTKFIGKRICIEYFISKPQSRMVKVSSRFMPLELVLILTVRLFAGDAKNPESGHPVGEVTFKFPRFSLNGELELASTMQSATSTTLQGKALATQSGGCGDNAIYAEITEINYSSTAATGLIALLVDPESIEVGEIPIVYGKYRDGHISFIPFEDCVYTPPINPDVGLVNGTAYTVSVGTINETFGVGADFVGNPLFITSEFEGGNSVAVSLYDGAAPYDREDITHNKNITIQSGDTSINIIGDENSSEYYTYSSDSPVLAIAGGLSVTLGE